MIEMTTNANHVTMTELYDLDWVDGPVEVGEVGAEWTLRLVDAPELAVADLDRDWFWKGTIEIPVHVKEGITDPRLLWELEIRDRLRSRRP